MDEGRTHQKAMYGIWYASYIPYQNGTVRLTVTVMLTVRRCHTTNVFPAWPIDIVIYTLFISLHSSSSTGGYLVLPLLVLEPIIVCLCCSCKELRDAVLGSNNNPPSPKQCCFSDRNEKKSSPNMSWTPSLHH